MVFSKSSILIVLAQKNRKSSLVAPVLIRNLNIKSFNLQKLRVFHKLLKLQFELY